MSVAASYGGNPLNFGKFTFLELDYIKQINELSKLRVRKRISAV